jgi:purine nucleosidase
MGGSLRAGGNETIAAEFNFAADPEAARLVFDAGFKDVALVPIDACDDTRLMWGDYQRLRRLTSPIARLISELLAGWDEAYFAMNGVGFYDPTAWLLGAEPSLAEWERVYVTVDTGGGPARGASVADWRRRTGRQPNARVATSVPKRDVFYEQFFQRLS